MNRTIFAMAGAFSAPSLLLADSALKGTALLLLATVAVMGLRRDSAATRHLVWQLALVALLVVPVLSALLPQWRVLPAWVGNSTQPLIAESSLPSIPAASQGDFDEPQDEEPTPIEERPAAEPPVAPPTAAVAETVPAAVFASPKRFDALPVVWAVGCGVLLLRLLAARWLLSRTERRGIVVGSSGQPTTANRDPLLTALEAACSQLGINHPVRLLIHKDRTIPVVWGIFRWRLLLPEAARQWSPEQLRSVLLHELAHIQRRDTIAQLMAQVACALHWFNPLVWFAAARLGMERERACDDLVLASGVRPSAYAGHLLDVVTGLSPARWTQTCGLAMARTSSLEGRLLAVLSAKSNRRRVSAFLAGLALAISVGVAVPVAMLRATDEQPAEKTKSAVPAATPAAPATPEKTEMKPKHEYAQALFVKWKANARTDGKIPGALIGRLASEIDSFLKQYPQDEKSPKLAALRPRLDATHDWTQADVVALLDDITAISTAPVSWTDLPIGFDAMQLLKRGQPLPADLQNVEWGAPAANGLRAAWLLDPRVDEYPFGSVLKSRVLFHNSGKEPVIFRTETWHQNDEHKARDAKGNEIRIATTRYTGITLSATYRLAPGQYCEVLGHGIAVGAGKYEEEYSLGGVGAVIKAKVGDDVRLSHTINTTTSTWSRPGDPKDPAELWKKNVAERVGREAPMPQAAADREQLLRRVTLDIFGVPPSAEEVAAFVADNAPDALAKLTARLQARPRPEPYSGTPATGETRFRVTAADPNAATKPRAANSPGRYVLGDSIRLLVSQTTTSSRRTNKAIIAFLSEDPNVASPHKPYEIALPDGLRSWGAVWERGTKDVWVMQKGLVRKVDFRDPAQVKETRFEPGTIADVPAPLREALGKAFDVGAAPAKDDTKSDPNTSATTPGDKEEIVFKRTRIRFTGSKTTFDNGRKTTFRENVRVFHAPGSDLNAADPTTPMKETLFMACEKLDIQIRKVNELVGDKRVEKTYLELFADGGSRNVNFRTDKFTGNSKTVKFDEQTDIIVFEGSVIEGSGDRLKYSPPPSKPNFNGNDLQVKTTLFRPVTIHVSPKVSGGRPETLEALKILYNRKTGEFQMDGVHVLSSPQPSVDPPAQASGKAPEGGGVKLRPAVEDRLRWGEPANGLRGALVIRTVGDEPKPGEMPSLFLAVQNVSNAPLRFNDAKESPKRRTLYVKRFGQIKAGVGFEWPTKIDVTLQPREVAYLLLFPADWKNGDSPSVGAVIAEGLVKDKDQTVCLEMEIKNAPAGAWNGKLVTGEADGVAAAGPPEPKEKKVGRQKTSRGGPTFQNYAVPAGDADAIAKSLSELYKTSPTVRVTATSGTSLLVYGVPAEHLQISLLRRWQADARRNGDIPGAFVGQLGDKVKEFIRNNTGDISGDPFAKKMALLVPRFDAGRDWKPDEAVALLKDVAAANTIPLETTLEQIGTRTFRKGTPLPKAFESAPWGDKSPSGLRLAWLLEPRAAEYRLDTPLASHILVQNAGKETVVFRARTWYQFSGHKAHDANGAAINVSSTRWTTLSHLVPVRLAPGEFFEVTAAGIGVGANKNDEDWQNTRVGSWIHAKAGDDVTFLAASVPLGEWNTAPQGDPAWWQTVIAERLSREMPLPQDAAERTRLLDRAVRDLFGNAPTADETAAFVVDKGLGALDTLAKRLAHRAGFVPFNGRLVSGPTTFRVLPADPDAAKRPRTASGPGRYTLDDLVRLVVSRRPVGERIVNEASIMFFSADPTKPAPGRPLALKLPDGYGTWAAAWVRGGTMLWVQQKGEIRSYDFSNPAQVKETIFQQAAGNVPSTILDALHAATDVPDAPATPTPGRRR